MYLRKELNTKTNKKRKFPIKMVTKSHKQKELMMLTRRLFQNNMLYHCQRITKNQCGMIMLIIKMIRMIQK